MDDFEPDPTTQSIMDMFSIEDEESIEEEEISLITDEPRRKPSGFGWFCNKMSAIFKRKKSQKHRAVVVIDDSML